MLPLNKIREDEELREKVTIIVERKDVTYKLNINQLNIL